MPDTLDNPIDELDNDLPDLPVENEADEDPVILIGPNNDIPYILPIDTSREIDKDTTGDKNTMKQAVRNWIYVTYEQVYISKLDVCRWVKERDFNEMYKIAHKAHYDDIANEERVAIQRDDTMDAEDKRKALKAIKSAPPKGETPAIFAREMMNCVHSTTYMPDDDNLLIYSDNGDLQLNIYKAPDIEEVPCEPEEMGFLIDHFCKLAGSKDNGDFLLDFVAHNVQKPGKKISFAVLLYGLEGTGKSFIGQLMRKLLGPNNTNSIDTDTVLEKYRDWVDRKVFVYVDDLARMPSGFHTAMKSLITMTDTMELRRFGVKAVHTRIYANFMFFTNEPDSIRINKDSRRFYVCGSYEPKEDPDYYTKLFRFAEANLGKIYYYFKHRDISQFNPYAEPPVTDLKKSLVTNTRTKYELDIYNHLFGAGGVEKHPTFNSDVVCVDDLADILWDESMASRTFNRTSYMKSLGRALNNEPNIYHPIQRISVDGKKKSAYIYDNKAYWRLLRRICNGDKTAIRNEYTIEYTRSDEAHRIDIDNAKKFNKIPNVVAMRLRERNIIVPQDDLANPDFFTSGATSTPTEKPVETEESVRDSLADSEGF